MIFTSGATEALATLLRLSPAIMNGGAAITRIIASAVEHSAALAPAGPDAELAPVDQDGVLRLDVLAELLAKPDAAILALQAANGETGVLQPITEASALARDKGSLTVCDAVAAFGKLGLDIKALGVDALVLSAHKIGGPKGVGAIILDGDRLQIAEPLIGGGGQEMRRRSGTENVAGIVGMAAAAESAIAAMDEERVRITALAGMLLSGVAVREAGSRALRRKGPSPSEHAQYRRSWAAVRDGGDRLRSCGSRGFLGLSLLVGQSAALACARRDGRAAGDRGWRAALLAGLDDD